MLNEVKLIGHLGRDPEQGGETRPVVLHVATSERWKSEDGQLQERTDWHYVVLWGRSREHVMKYLRQGSRVFVEGKLRHEQYHDRETGEVKYATKIESRKVLFLDRNPNGGGSTHDVPDHIDEGPPY